MIAPQSIKLTLIAPSGSGKSTVAGLIGEYAAMRGLDMAVVKLATPLYYLQSEIYRLARTKVGADQQNHVLMESMADHLRAVNPKSIVTDFLERLRKVRAPIVVNDDLRDGDVDWPVMREEGFRAVRVAASTAVRKARLVARQDLTTIEVSKLDARIARIPIDVEIRNDSDGLDGLRAEIARVMDGELARVTGKAA